MTREFLGLAAKLDFIWGVVGWVDLTSVRVGDDLDGLVGGPGGDRLVGIRHQVHDESDPQWLGRADVRRGLAAVEARRLRFDLLVRPRELPAAVDAVRQWRFTPTLLNGEPVPIVMTVTVNFTLSP